MANMSYCRFENTLSDLRDCNEALQSGDDEDMSASEKRARERLINLCAQIAANYGDE